MWQINFEFEKCIITFIICWKSCVLGVLPPSSEQYDEEKGIKVITEFKYNDDSKMVKVRIIHSYLRINFIFDWLTIGALKIT